MLCYSKMSIANVGNQINVAIYEAIYDDIKGIEQFYHFHCPMHVRWQFPTLHPLPSHSTHLLLRDVYVALQHSMDCAASGPSVMLAHSRCPVVMHA